MIELIGLSLKFNPKLEPAFYHPQSCYLWCSESVRKRWSLFPGEPAVCRLQNGCRFLWRIYSHLDRNSTHREAYFAHPTVELDGEAPQVDEENVLVEIVPIQTPLEDFQQVTVDVRLDCSCLKVELLLTAECLVETLRTLLKGTFLCKRSRINLTNGLRERNMGICGAYVKDTLGASAYGEVGQNTAIKIDQILYHAQPRPAKPLGGMRVAREQLEAALTENRSLLLIGASGAGKYSLINAIAVERNLPLFEIRGSHALRSLPGETEAELRRTFERMRLFEELIGRDKPALLLVKDIDTVCPKVGTKRGEEVANIARIASQFLLLVDQCRASAANVIIVGTTSCIERVDTRLRRPGRLDREITIAIPSRDHRMDMLRCFQASTRGTLTDEQLHLVAQRTAGYVAAELELLFYNLAREMYKRQRPFEEALAVVQKRHRPSSHRNAAGLVGGDASLRLDSFGGMDALKALLRLCIVEQLANPARFRRLGIHPLRGILLYGPPGCAKTTLAKCIAAETGMTFLALSAAELYSPYVGDAEKLITRVFDEARTNAPAVVFLDEIDSLVGNRGTAGMKGGSGAVNMGVLSTLLMEMDGIGQAEQAASALSEDAKRVIVIAATNRPDMVDDALLRPGRLTRLIHLPAPDRRGRLEILRKLASTIPLAEDVRLEAVAERTERFSGADLQNLCTQAALNAAAEDLNATVVNMSHFSSALLDVRPSLTKEQIDWYHSYEANRLR